ncbi:hypothetical protein F2Q68_00026958, partial [Brassica cretica]
MRIRSSFLAIFLLPSSPSHSLPSHSLTFLSILLSLRSSLCLMLNPEKTQMVNVVIRNLGLPSLEVEVGGASLLSSSLLMPSSFLRFMCANDWMNLLIKTQYVSDEVRMWVFEEVLPNGEKLTDVINKTNWHFGYEVACSLSYGESVTALGFMCIYLPSGPWLISGPRNGSTHHDIANPMTKRAAEEAPPSMDSCTTGPNFLGCDRDQVAELLSQEERIPHHGDGDTKKSSAEIIGADISSLKREKLKALLRQCVRDIIPGVDEMPTRARSMHLMSQLSNKKPSISVTNKEVKDDIQLLMKSDPGLFKGIVKKHTLNDMQQQAEQLLDTVATSCSGRPMSQEEKRDLQKSIKALPRGNLKRVAEIIRDHYVASGKEFSDEVTVNLEEEDNVMLWRLHFYVAAVKSARKLGSTAISPRTRDREMERKVEIERELEMDKGLVMERDGDREIERDEESLRKTALMGVGAT